jgi:hypothetical protein
MSKLPEKKHTRGIYVVWGTLYLLMLYAVVTSMQSVRQQAIADFSNPTAQQNWDKWRSDVANKITNQGTVDRRVSKSPETPTLRLLRDHFAVCLVGALLMTSLLFVSVMFFVNGVLFSPAFQPRTDSTL